MRFAEITRIRSEIDFCEVWLPYHGFYWSHLANGFSNLPPFFSSRGLGCAIKAGVIFSLMSRWYQSLFSAPKSIGPWQLLLKKLDSLWRFTLLLMPTLFLNFNWEISQIQPCPSWTCFPKVPCFCKKNPEVGSWMSTYSVWEPQSWETGWHDSTFWMFLTPEQDSKMLFSLLFLCCLPDSNSYRGSYFQ